MTRDLDAQVEAALAKKFSAEIAAPKSVTVSLYASNGRGRVISAVRILDRLLTSALLSAYLDGTTEMQNERIGAALLKRYGRAPSISSR